MRSYLLAHVISYIWRKVNTDDDNESTAVQSPESENEDKFDIWSPHRKMVYKQRIRKQHEGANNEMGFTLQIQFHLKSDIFQNWEEIKTVVPKFYVMARKY